MENIKYNKTVMKHFLHPKNMGIIKNPDAVGEVGNIACGDIFWLYLKIAKRKVKGKEESFIKDIKFKTMGCAAAIATSSMITELAKGKSLKEAKKITRDDVASSLEGLPKIKMHCSNLASEALKQAIEKYERKKECDKVTNISGKIKRKKPEGYLQ